MLISSPSVTRVSHRTIADPRNALVPAADVSASTPGARIVLDGYEYSRMTESRVIVATAHGLDVTDEGKPLFWKSIYNDTDATHFPTAILTQVINDNSLRIQQFGLVTFPTGLIEGGATYDPDPAADGPFVFWDLSQTLYVAQLPADSSVNANALLYVQSIASGTVTAEIWR